MTINDDDDDDDDEEEEEREGRWKWISWEKKQTYSPPVTWRLVEAMLHIRGHHREAQEAMKSEAEKDI